MPNTAVALHLVQAGRRLGDKIPVDAQKADDFENIVGLGT